MFILNDIQIYIEGKYKYISSVELISTFVDQSHYGFNFDGILWWNRDAQLDHFDRIYLKPFTYKLETFQNGQDLAPKSPLPILPSGLLFLPFNMNVAIP